MRSVHISPRTLVDSLIVEDAEVMANAMADGLRGEYVQLEARPFRGTWTTVRLEGMVVQLGREDVATVRRLRVPADRAAFVIPMAISPLARWNARAIAPHQMLACLPGAECFAFDPRGTRFAIVSLPLSAVAAAAACRVCGSDGSRIITPTEASAFELHRYLTSTTNAIDLAPGQGRSVARDLAAEVERRLVACVDSASARPTDADSSRSRSRIVRRAEDFYRSHVGEPVTIAQLSSLVGVSERSLRNAFYDVYTTGPKRFLKLWQLHQVRRELRAGRTSVTDIATFNGFYELGRFAGEYKALFGEVPSETLHKARLRNNVQTAGAQSAVQTM